MFRSQTRVIIAAGLLFGLMLLSGQIIKSERFENRPDQELFWASVTGLEAETANQWYNLGGFETDLETGSHGPEVRLLQQILAQTEAEIYPEHLITGYYGPITAEAVEQWQQRHGLPAVGRVGPQTRAQLNEIYFDKLCPEPDKEFSDKTLKPISPEVGLPDGYIPPDLVDLSDRVKTLFPVCLRADAASALTAMFQAANQDGLELAVSSGFRRSEIQFIIHQYFLTNYGQEAIDFSARPGHSEHQLGTTVDLTGRSIVFQPAADEFAGSPEEQWLHENAFQYGFVLSYPKNAQDITGYIYEPWHWRYIGRTPALDFRRSGKSVLFDYLTGLQGSSERPGS